MVTLLVEYYGRDNCNIVYVKREEPWDWFYFMDSRPVQILILDDASFVKVSRDLASLYTDIRHQLEDKGVKRGVVFTIVAGHRLHAIDMAFRMFADMFCVLSTPFNQWDYAIVSKMYGIQKHIEELRKLDRRKMEYSGARTRFLVWLSDETYIVDYTPRPFNVDRVVKELRKMKVEQEIQEKEVTFWDILDRILTLLIVYGAIGVVLGSILLIVLGMLWTWLFYI